MVEHWGWHNDHAYIVDATGGTEITGIPIDKSGLFLPDAVTVNPRKLCDAYASGVEIICNSTINEITKQGDQWLVNGVLYDAVILANAMGVTDIAQANDLVEKVKLYPVRGQMSIAPETSETSVLKTILNYRGYLSPSLNGTHALGSTFDRKNLNLDILQSDHEENVSYLEETVPSMRGKIRPIQGRAAFRVSSKYRFPLCAAVGEAYPNLYVSTAHGSHGLISTIFGAAIIHNRLCSSLKLYG
jgi:tRNA 5-methylaminomethyl-2-thiouridine biosynthesis bifunctional protein